MKALVLGKFMPFHRGHQALIEFALGRADSVAVLVCASEQESIPLATRCRWIQATFSQEKRLQIVPFAYLESNLPNSSEAAIHIAQAWAAAIRQLLPDIGAVCSSEAYGTNLAACLKVPHFLFDQNRTQLPVSASLIRQNPVRYWSYLPAAVKPFYQQKIVLLGTESTGKSSISKALAHVLPATLVEEAGRQIVAHSQEVTISQLYQIVDAHQEAVTHACQALTPYLIMDTDIHITQSYAHFFFGQYLEVDTAVYLRQAAGRYFYLNADFPYVQDGTRLAEATRNTLDLHHQKTLAQFRVDYQVISGNWQQRLHQTQALITG